MDGTQWWRRTAVALTGMVLAYACAAEEEKHTTTACVPGESNACTGPSGCSGFQVCAADGERFDPCQCAGTGGTTAEAGKDGAVGTGGLSGAPSDASLDSSADASGDGAQDVSVQDVQWLPYDAPGDVGKTVCGQCMIANCAKFVCDPNSSQFCADCFDVPCSPQCSMWLKDAYNCAQLLCKDECCQ